MLLVMSNLLKSLKYLECNAPKYICLCSLFFVKLILLDMLRCICFTSIWINLALMDLDSLVEYIIENSLCKNLVVCRLH